MQFHFSSDPERLKNRPIERMLGYRFRNPELLDQALTHRSVLPQTGRDRSQANEQLEFLGDAVLELVIVDHLFRRFPEKTEGDLTKLKSMIVSGDSLQAIAQKLNLGDYIIMSENEARNGGRNRHSILEDTFEAVIAAIYLDGGRKPAERFIKKNLLAFLDEIIDEKLDTNFKSQLLEYAQSNNGGLPVYSISKESGPDHNKKFEVAVSLKGTVVGKGIGKSKKTAQQNAARNALSNLKII